MDILQKSVLLKKIYKKCPYESIPYDAIYTGEPACSCTLHVTDFPLPHANFNYIKQILFNSWFQWSYR